MNDVSLERLLQELSKFDTPTICNALDFVIGKSNAGFTRSPVIAAQPHLPPVAGIVATARIRSHASTKITAEEYKNLRLEYYEYVARAPRPTVIIIQDLDDQPGLGGMWGEVTVALHKGLGVSAALTNGAMRDLDVLDPWFPLFAGSISVSHAFVHLVDFAVEVEVFGQKFSPGDLIHVDRHGGLKLPKDRIADLPAAVDLVMRKESPLLKAAKSPGFTIEMLKKALQDSEKEEMINVKN